MWRFNKQKFQRSIVSILEALCIIAGVTCLFFGFTPSGFQPHAREEAWGLALPLFGVALALMVWDTFLKRFVGR